MNRSIGILHYWGGCPQTPNSKWQRFLHLLKCCAERDWQTYLVWSHMPEDPQLSKPFTDFGCKILLQPRVRGNFDWRCVRRTYRMLRGIRCDVFHCHNIHTSPLIAAALASVPVRIWSKLAMSPYYERGRRPKGYHRLALSTRVSCALAHRVLPLSNAVRDELMDLGVPARKLTVVPAPVERDDGYNVSGNCVRHDLGITGSQAIVSAVGHAVPVKGWDILIKAFAKVVERAPQARLLLVGSTSAPHEVKTTQGLHALIDRLGVRDRVHFLGQRNDVAQILAASDVFAFPSRSEGQGLALTEALAAGLPCVAARVGGIPELIEHGHNGLLFAREAVDELSGQLVVLISNEALRRRLGQAAVESVRRFDFEAHTDLLVDLYRSLLERSRCARIL